MVTIGRGEEKVVAPGARVACQRVRAAGSTTGADVGGGAGVGSSRASAGGSGVGGAACGSVSRIGYSLLSGGGGGGGAGSGGGGGGREDGRAERRVLSVEQPGGRSGEGEEEEAEGAFHGWRALRGI